MRKLLRIPKHSISWLLLCGLVFHTTWLPAAPDSMSSPRGKTTTPLPVGPPVFTDPIPQNITVSCISDVPPPISLMATDDNDPSYPKNIVSVDNPAPASLDACANATITRTWTAVDNVDNRTSVATQIITVEADVTGPAFNLEPVNKTVACEVSKMDAPASADRYDTWLSSLRLALSTRLNDNLNVSIS